jgi:hypothetical protein
MPDCTFEYAVIRVVPRVERGEFLNVGVLLYCLSHDFLQARLEVDWSRLQIFAPQMDVEMVDEYLKLIPLICEGGPRSGPIGQMPQRARFHWLVAPRSTIIQLSPVHSGLCDNPHAALENLLERTVRL